ncbi:MAG: hemerythrin domain-containing protein [Xanthobacteraceae bacterium]
MPSSINPGSSPRKISPSQFRFETVVVRALEGSSYREAVSVLKYSSTRILHDDHVATVALLADVERLVVTRRAVPVQGDQETGRLIDRLCRALNEEVCGHFDFEEVSVFPMLAEYGAADLGDLFTEEHRVLREVMNDIVANAGAERAAGFSPESWTKFRRLCGELVERLTSHIDKEERALIPALEDALTPEIDTEVAARHDLSS